MGALLTLVKLCLSKYFMTTTYYKHFAESIAGEGIAFFEVCNNIITRQVEIYGGKQYWADGKSQKSSQFMLADRFASEINLKEEHEVTRQQFDKVWESARRSESEAYSN
jgi:hypothetical protein